MHRIHRAAFLAGAIAAGAILAGCGETPPAGIKFGSYQAGYASKPDLARVEHEFPLARNDLALLTPGALKAYDQEQIDQVYARLTAGPIPDGAFDGDLFFPKGISGDRRIREIIGGLSGLAAGVGAVKVELVGKHLWRGKVFYRDELVLRNRIDDTSLLKPLIDGELATIPKVTVNGTQGYGKTAAELARLLASAGGFTVPKLTKAERAELDEARTEAVRAIRSMFDGRKKYEVEAAALAEAKRQKEADEKAEAERKAKADALAKKARYPGDEAIVDALIVHFSVTDEIAQKWLAQYGKKKAEAA